MAARDLCTLADVKTWIGVATNDADAKLSPLIPQASAAILAELNRGGLLTTTYTERRDGTGGDELVLKNWPVLSVASVTIDGTVIPESLDGIQAGWMLDDAGPAPPGRYQSIVLVSYRFTRARRNVVVVYTAGYGVVAEPQTVAAGAATVTGPYGNWSNDNGVTYVATGAALTLVSGAPAQGQYQLNAAAPGGYTFNVADNGLAVAISYDYVPHVLRGACAELVAERYKYRDRIGQVSKSLGGSETASFDNSGITKFVAARLQNFKSVMPI